LSRDESDITHPNSYQPLGARVPPRGPTSSPSIFAISIEVEHCLPSFALVANHRDIGGIIAMNFSNVRDRKFMAGYLSASERTH